MDDRHVDHGLDVAAPEQVLRLALADVEVVHLEVLRRPREGSPIDSHHPVRLVQQPRQPPAEVAADSGDEDGVARHPATLDQMCDGQKRAVGRLDQRGMARATAVVLCHDSMRPL